MTTPQAVALADSRRAVAMYRKLDIPTLGVIENMSHYVCPSCAHQSDIFGHGGGERMAEEMNVPFLGGIPIYEPIRSGSDTGTPLVNWRPGLPGCAVVLPYRRARSRSSVDRELRGHGCAGNPPARSIRDHRRSLASPVIGTKRTGIVVSIVEPSEVLVTTVIACIRSPTGITSPSPDGELLDECRRDVVWRRCGQDSVEWRFVGPSPVSVTLPDPHVVVAQLVEERGRTLGQRRHDLDGEYLIGDFGQYRRLIAGPRSYFEHPRVVGET